MNLMTILSLSLLQKSGELNTPLKTLDIILKIYNFHPSEEMKEPLVAESKTVKFGFDCLAEKNDFFLNILSYEDRLIFLEAIITCLQEANTLNANEKNVVKLAVQFQCKKKDFIMMIKKQLV